MTFYTHNALHSGIFGIERFVLPEHKTGNGKNVR